MKKNKMNIIIGLLITLSIVYSDPLMEGELKISGFSTEDVIDLTAEGTAAWNGVNEDWTICTDNDFLDITLTGKSIYILDFISDTTTSTGPDGIICHAKYKLKKGSDSIYVNWLDCDYKDGTGSFGTDYNTADIYIRWNSTKFQHKNDSSGIWYDISAGSTIGIWDGDRKDNTNPAYDDFKPTTPTNLSYTVVNNKPNFSWTASEPEEIVTYTLLRDGSYVASNITGTTYTDTRVHIPGSNIYYYKVQANLSSPYNTDSEGYSNTLPVKRAQILVKQIANVEPDHFRVSNSPNPFNPYTTIQYGLPEDSFVELFIFDLFGREVKSLIKGNTEAGFKSITWDSKDNNGNPLPSGMYIINMTAQSLESNTYFTRSKKLILLK